MIPFDAVVVGAGLAGCRMARDLARGGLSVAVLEAGPLRSDAEIGAKVSTPTTRQERRRFARDGQPVQARNILLAAHNRSFYVDDRRHPYLADRPFLWFRGRQVGGRSLLWSRTCLRLSDREFFPWPGSAHWENWPFGHDELARFYARVERDLGVCGEACGLAALPDSTFTAPAVSTPRIDGFLDRLRAADPSLRATFARTAAFERSSVPAVLREAVRYGARVFADSPVARILMKPGSRRAWAVEVEGEDSAASVVPGRIIVLCASTIETVRILWQSRSALHPQGIGNHADQLGRGLQDHLAINCAGPLAPGLRALAHRSLADPRDPWREEPAHALVWGQERCPPAGSGPGGSDAIDCLASCQLAPDSSFWSMLVLGASRALPVHRITAERIHAGTAGGTVPRIFLRRTSEDRARLVALGRFAERVACAGGLGPIGYTPARRLLHRLAPRWAMSACRRAPGAVIHETGGARMGNDPAQSVVDPWGRCWDTDNVYVADGSVFPSAGFQNPTLTILAIAARTADHLLERRPAGGEPAPGGLE